MLASLKRPDADAVLTDWFDQMLAGQSPPGLHLDLWLETEVYPTAELQTRAETFSKGHKIEDRSRPRPARSRT